MQWIYVMYSTKKKYVMFSLKCMSSGQKNDTGIIVPFNFVPFNFVSKSSMSWHCFESKRTNMHVSEFLNAKCLFEVTRPWRLWTFCGRCFICWRECLLKGMSVRMEHATASSASSDAVELRMQRHCEMMQDGVAELLSFLLPSFVKLVFCWCVQPSVCRSLRCTFLGSDVNEWTRCISPQEMWRL